MRNEIAKIAFHGINADEPEVMKICLEKIFTMITNNVSEEKAAKILNENNIDKIRIEDQTGHLLEKKFGSYKGYSKFKLALDFFQMSNDRFFEIYKFNFVPYRELAKVAKEYIAKRQNLNVGMSTGLGKAIQTGLSIGINQQMMRSTKNTFKLGS
ncbi:hypothetical protein [Enterococcus dispar]|uniref:hypothetical protein n=1 Tax=Enterococcus dispar TaxID=44009 RepID=UPI002490665B|nr:hypothetical protein [Enterococcus dispar]